MKRSVPITLLLIVNILLVLEFYASPGPNQKVKCETGNWLRTLVVMCRPPVNAGDG